MNFRMAAFYVASKSDQLFDKNVSLSIQNDSETFSIVVEIRLYKTRENYDGYLEWLFVFDSKLVFSILSIRASHRISYSSRNSNTI